MFLLFKLQSKVGGLNYWNNYSRKYSKKVTWSYQCHLTKLKNQSWIGYLYLHFNMNKVKIFNKKLRNWAYHNKRIQKHRQILMRLYLIEKAYWLGCLARAGRTGSAASPASDRPHSALYPANREYHGEC